MTHKMLCYHCGNKGIHTRPFETEGLKVYDWWERDMVFHEKYKWIALKCGNCESLSVFGGFVNSLDENNLESYRLYPLGSKILPESHTISPDNPLPEIIIKTYEEIWPLMQRSPNAFAGQIRRLLEFICKDKGASTGDLYHKIMHLSTSGVFPGYYANMTDLLRRVGNMGAHMGEREVDYYDAELLDSFFRSIVDYVYIMPAQINRLNQRIKR
jgi:hypothetical protein